MSESASLIRFGGTMRSHMSRTCVNGSCFDRSRGRSGASGGNSMDQPGAVFLCGDWGAAMGNDRKYDEKTRVAVYRHRKIMLISAGLG